MAEIILATHGKMASGVADALKLLVGVNPSLHLLEAYNDNEAIEQKIDHLCAQLDLQQQWIFVCDLPYGSVAQALAIRFMKTPDQVKLLCGFNLGLILRLTSLRQAVFSDDQLRDLIQESRQDLVLLSDLFQPSSDF